MSSYHIFLLFIWIRNFVGNDINIIWIKKVFSKSRFSQWHYAVSEGKKLIYFVRRWN